MTAHSQPSPLHDTGSPTAGEPVFLAVGQLGRPHGVQGAISMRILTDFPERLQPGVTVFVGPAYTPMRIRQAQTHRKKLLLAFEYVQTREQAAELTNAFVFVHRAELPPLPEGEYYQHQLLGLRVFSADDGEDLGKLEEILPTGANDVYLIRMNDGRELLLPAIEGILQHVDLPNRTMTVHVLPGALPPEPPGSLVP